MFLRIFIPFLLSFTVVETCVRTIPPEEYYPSSTLPPNKCETCDINKIKPENLQTGTVFDSVAIPTTGDCISISARCSRTDGQVCTSVIISSVTSTTSTVLGTVSNAAEVSARLDCNDNGMYSSGMATEVSRLSCAFTGCELPCSTCDINMIAPTGLGTGEKFSFVEQGAAGACKQTQVTCARDDGLICESISINAPGPAVIATTSQTMTTSAVLTCQADKSYSFEAITAINQLTCVYTNCVAPCLSCDTAALTPTSLPTGASFEFSETDGICKSATVTCKRDDMATCTISISAISPMGTTVLGAMPFTSSVSATLDCGGDELYSVDVITGISKISCDFTDCILPCETCNINDIAPTGLGTGEKFSFVEQGAVRSCKQTQVTCARDDGLICESISINAPGSTVIATTLKTTKTSAVLTCQADKTYSSGAINAITQLTCAYTNCVEPCKSCDPASLEPMLEMGEKFEFLDLTNPTCRTTEFTCKRDDTATCTITISATSPSGTTVLISTPSTNSVPKSLTCGPDGLYTDGPLTGITRLSCGFTNCISCKTCDITTISPPSVPSGSTFEFTEQGAPGACKQTEVVCRRTDDTECDSVAIEATIPSGSSDLGSAANSDMAKTTLTCGANGVYTDEMGVQINQLACSYNNCALKCKLCNINSIAPTGLPTGEEFQFAETAGPFCKITKVTCKRNDGKICGKIAINEAETTELTSVENTNTVSLNLVCQNDKMFTSDGVSSLTQLSCVFTDCLSPCETCDIGAITPTGVEPGAAFEYTETSAAGACKTMTVKCKRTDGKTCDLISMDGSYNAPPITMVDGTGSVSEVSAPIECQADGKFAFGTSTGLSQISCFFINCVSCQSCDIATIPVTTPTGSTFEFIQLAPGEGGCINTEVTCKRTDGMICSEVKIMGTAPKGTFEVASDVNTDQMSAFLNCQANGKYEGGNLQDISQLTCDYTDCKMPCELCDITPLAPTGLPAGQIFQSLEQGASGACKQTLVGCFRNDGRVCASISINGPGSVVLKSDMGASGVVAELACQNDRTYSLGTITQITELSCTYTDCKLGCEMCDFNKIVPTPVAGISFSFMETIGADGCKSTQMTCKNDNQECGQAAIVAQLSSGTEFITNAIGVGFSQVSATLQCLPSGQYLSPSNFLINQISCEFNGCSPKQCSLCDISTIPVTTNIPQVTFIRAELGTDANGCKLSRIQCSRGGVFSCASKVMTGTFSNGDFSIIDESVDTYARSILTCGNDGKYYHGTGIQLQSVYCNFVC